MKGETHRKPGPPLRRFDEGALEKWDKDNLNKLGPQSGLDASLAPNADDADNMRIGKRSPIR